MKIIADENIPLITEAFRELGEVVTLPTPRIVHAAVRDADVLVIRNETRINEALLGDSRVRFVSSATIGTDHVDFPYLHGHHIGFANAPGCNSNSVKEYVVAALLRLAARDGFSLAGKTMGVVGVGNIGSKVVAAARALGMNVMENDPPLERATGDRRFVTLDKILGADFITLHTPLTRTGQDATAHLFDDQRFSRVKKGAVLLNTSRGAVVETAALKRALQEQRLSAALIDVWENEPSIDAELLSQAALGTAHVAGYSIEGKLTAVRMIRKAAFDYFSISSDWDPARHLAPPKDSEITVDARVSESEAALRDIVRQVYDIDEDDRRLREMLALAPERRAAYYSSLRTGYRFRREFSNFTVHLRPEQKSLMPTLSALGFVCDLAG